MLLENTLISVCAELSIEPLTNLGVPDLNLRMRGAVDVLRWSELEVIP